MRKDFKGKEVEAVPVEGGYGLRLKAQETPSPVEGSQVTAGAQVASQPAPPTPQPPVPASGAGGAPPAKPLDQSMDELGALFGATPATPLAPVHTPHTDQGDGTRAAPVEITTAADMDAIRDRIARKPTDGQKDANNYAQGHATWNGLKLGFETPRGGERRSKTTDAVQWVVPNHPTDYGKIKGFTAPDGDEVDLHMGPNPESKKIFVIDQYDTNTNTYDEPKVMGGFDTMAQAQAAYDAAFTDGKGPQRRVETTETDLDGLNAWLPTANKPVPFADSPQAKAPSKGQEAPSSPPDAAPSPQPSAAGESADNRQKPAEPDVKTADSAPGDNRVLSTGARLKSKSGREMSPVPKIDATGERKTINTLRRVDEWLLAEAKKEAEGQKYLTTLLSAINVKNMSQSDRDTLNEVLFGGDGATEANLIKEGPAPGLAPSPGPAAPAAPPQTLMEFLSQVGIKADDPALKELTNFDVLKEWRKTFSKNILRADGQPLLQAIQRAHEAGFLGRRATAEDTEAYTNEDLKPLDEALFQLARGKQTVRDEDQTAQQDAEDARRFRDTNRADMEQIAEGHGIDPQGLTDADLEALLDAERAKDAAIDAEERAAIEAVESELQQAENAPDEEAIPFEDGATAGPPGQVAREGDDEGRDGQEAAPQGEEAGAGGGEGLPEPPGPVSETPSQEPSQEVEPPRVNVLDVGERLEGARKHAFDQLDAATKAKIEASEQVKALLEETSRSALFPIALDAEASNGTRAYLERVRGTLKTFLDTVNSLTGGRKGAKSRWMKRLSPVEAITKFWADGTEQDRIDIVKKAAEYTAFVRELENITKNALTIEEAEKALARAMIEDYDASLAQWEARTQSYAAPSKFFKKTKFGEQYDDFSSKTYIERHFAPDDYYHLSKGLVDDIADDDTGKAKPLRPPKIDNVVREGLPERRKDNRNVTPEDFMNTFGFRGVQFGNYVNQAEGMRAINAAYDALLDLADTLGFEPKNIGFPKDGKRMGIAFGARGQGGKAAAHYEPSQHVINITKNSGDGTLAHEWMHALDYALRASKTQSGRYTEFVNQIKNALQTKYSAIDAVNQLDRLLKGESWINNDKRRGPIQTAKDYIDHIWHRWNSRPTTFAQQAKELGAYWKDPVELWARAGEAAIYDMIPGKSPYLVSDWVSDSYVTKSAGYRGQPYPSGDERVAFSTMFANFFGALRFVNGEVTIDDAYRGPSAEMRKPVQDALDEIGKDLPGRRDRLLGRTNNDNVFVDPVERAKRFGKPSKYWNDDTLNRQGLGLSFADFFTVETNKFASISAAQRMAEDLVGGAITAPGDIKAVEEAVELGAVIAGRRIYERMSRDGADHATIFQAMVDLYYRQPPLLTRTSTSATNQAYSTPVPMAYLANVLARVTPEDTLYEPTAGQGALAITAHAPFVQANELDAKRAQSLILQGFQVTTADAMTNRVSGADVVIANPPFGTVKNDKGEIQTFKTEKFDTTAVDHAIALKALESMRENGRAVLIIAGQKHLGSDPDGARRQALYNTPKNRAFFKYLFDTYNVTEHFTIDGALYKRQGAAWPIDVIVINGRGKSELKLPGAQPPKTYESFDDLKALLNGTPHGATERELDTEAVGLGAGRPAADVGGSESAAGPDDGTGVAQRPGSPGAGPNQPGTGRSGNRGPRAGGGGRAAAGPEEQEGMGGDAVPGGAGDQADAQSEQPDVAGPSDAVGPRGGDIAPGDDAGKLAERDQRLSDLENFDDIFDEALGGPAAEDLTQPPSVTLPTQGQGPVDEAEGTPRPQPRTVGEASKSAAINTAQGLDDALSGLSKLFGADPTRMTSGIGFDPETYKKAKPLFLDALAHFKGAAVDVKAMVAAFVNHARNVAKWADDVIQRMKPYLKQFITEALDGRIPGFGPQVKRRENTEIETSFQTRYEPASNATPVGTLIPSNMKTSVIEALESLSKRQGDLDTYVAQKIGMTKQQVLDGFSAEQVDALALAIDNVEQGKGFIIGDQTGVGKGRFVAGMIKYALHNNITPIFVTKDAKLYGDMFRDTADIGMGDQFKPLMTNNNIGVALDDGRVVRSLSSAKNQPVLNEIAKTGNLPANYTVLMTTYSQLQTKGGVKVPRHHAIEALAKGAMLILDEAHEAGGTDGGFKKTDKDGNVLQTRSEYVRELIASAKGTVYSSATYAKNPHVMTLYFKTDMADAVENIKDLSETIKRGGVPLQQVVANMLVRAGQYLRRERSFEGVQFSPKKSDLDMEAYRSMAGLLREIFALDSRMTEVREKYGAFLNEEGEGLGDDNAVGDEGVTSATFSSMMHNVIGQTLMALKADAAAQEAIDAWKAGKKPIIALANTMGSFLEDHIDRHNLKTGSDVTSFTANQLFLRYLDRTRTVSIKDAYDKKKVTKHYITDEEMAEMGFGDLINAFEHVASQIEGTDLSTVPASPIDHIREKMTAAGMKVDEITGRQVRIETRNGVKKLATRQATIAEKGRLVNGFNSGTIDGLIINRSGSTGLSMHASVKYKDQKTRVMILVQADPNIDVFMQMLGRIHRTGQVVPPEYIMLSGNVPSERRPAAITAGKMKSLNANTSANSDSAFTDSEALDFMNQYGDEVVAEILRNDPELQSTLQIIAKDASKEEGGNSNDGIARKVTGRASILTPEEQEQLFDQIADEYTSLIARLDAINENTLVAKKRDLQAATKQKFVLVPGKGEGSPFVEPAYLERIEMNRLGKPYPMDVIQGMVQENVGGAGKRPVDWFTDREAQQKALFDAYTADLFEAEKSTRKDLDDLIKERREFADLNGQPAAQHKFAPLVVSAELMHEKASNRVKEARALNNAAMQYLYSFQPGRAVKITIGKDEDVQEFLGIVLDHTYTERAKNPLALSNTAITVAVADAVRELEIPYSQLANQKYVMAAHDPAEVRGAFGMGLTSSRETRWMITGNLLSGFNTFRKGQMIIYTDAAGDTREGILMAPKFNPEKELDKRATRLGPEHVVPYLKQTPQAKGIVTNKDGAVIITRDSGFDYVIKIRPKGGRQFYTHPDLVRIMGNFVQKGGKGAYTAKTSRPEKIAEVAALIADKFDTGWQTDQYKDIAKKLTGEQQLTEAPVQRPTGMLALRRRIRSGRTEQIETVDGMRDQFVLPGAEQSQEQVAQAEADRQKAELDLRAKQSKLRPGVAQQEPGGLFGEPAPKQGTLFGGMRRPTDGRTLQSVMDGLVGRFRRYDPTGKAELIFVPEIRRMIDGELYGADGHYLDRVITVALDGQDMTWTLDHEIIHYLKDMGLIRKAEWKALVRAAKNPANTTRMSPEAEANYRKAYDNDEAKVDEELVADLHAGWQRGDIDLHGLPRTVMQRIQDFFRTIWEVLTGQGFNTPESVFERIASGEVGRRAGKQRLTATQRFAAAWSGQDFGDDLSDQVGAGAGPVGDMPATPDEGLSDGARVAAKELAKALVSNTPVVKPFSGLNVEGRRMVLSVMNRLMEDQQVLDAVVGFIPIDVVNMLGGQQLTTDALLDNPSVLVDLLPVDPNDLVASGVQAMDVLAPAVAIAAAKIETGLARFDVSAADFLTASGAVRHWLTPAVSAKVPQPSTFDKDVKVQEKFSLRRADQTQTPEFKAWFGDSKVVDENGNPLVVYHGTTAKAFSAFDTSKEGAHFGSREQAQAVADKKRGRGGRSKLIPVYLSIQNPLRVDADIGVWDNFNNVHRYLSVGGYITPKQADAAWDAWQRSDNEGWKALKDALRAQGHDGIVYDNDVEGDGDSYIAFEPTQIKAVDNNGAFDPNNPKMRFGGLRKAEKVAIPISVSADDGMGVAHAQYAKFWEDPEGERDSYAQFAIGRDGNLHLATMVAESPEGPRGREILRWLRDTYGKPIVVHEPSYEAESYWEQMEKEGLVARTVETQFKGKTVEPVTKKPMFALRPRAAGGPSIFGDNEQARATQNEEHEQVATPLITTLSGGALTPESVRRAVDGWRTALQDRFLPLLRTQQAIEESLGRPLRDDENAYQAETLSAGRKGAKLDDLAEDHVRPLFEDMQRRNVTVDELEMFLYARHAPERNARIASINPDFAEGEGSGMTDAEAEEIMIVAEASGKMSDLEALAARVDAIRDQALQERIDGGLLSQEQADAWTETYENYVPLRGRGELDPTLEADRPSIAKGISVRGPESRRAFGRRSRASDILAYTIMQAQEAILRAETNRVAQAFHQLAVNNPNPDFWKVNKVTTKPVWNKATGQVEQRSTSRIAAEDADYTVSLKIDGKEHRVTLNRDNPDALRLAEAMRSLKPEQISSFIRVFGGINRFLSTVNTTLNYEFVITNAFRDLQTAMVNLNQFDMPNIVSNTLKDYFPAMKAATKGAFQKFDGEWGRWYKEYRDAGGKVYFNGIEDIREQRRNVERAVKNAQPGFSARRAASQIFQVIERLNNGVENAIRLAAYKNARQAGMNVDQAAALAKNLTVNFNRRGSYGPLINSLYLFFNASVQGTATMLNAMRSPKVRKVLGAAVATGVLLALMNSMVSDDDDDGEKIYDKIPEYEKQRNLIIMEPGGKEYWKIPLPYGYNIFFNIGRNMVDLYNGKDVGKVLASQAETIVDSFNPIGGAENLLNMIAPTVADPIVDLFQNKDFTGRKIMPDQPQYGPPEPNNQRYWGSVSPISKAITDFLNEGTGGDDVVPGLIDISPEVLDYLFGQATGAAGQSWARLADWPLKVADPTSEITWNDIPMARRVQGQLGPWVNRSLFYDRAGEVALLMDNYKDYAKSGRTAEAEAFYEKNKALMGLAPMADKMRDTMSLMRRVNEAEKLARDKGEMTKEDYLKGLDERRKVETEMIAVFNNAFLVAKKER